MGERRDVSNDISGEIAGSAVQAHTINGGVHVHGALSRQSVPGASPDPNLTGFAREFARAYLDVEEERAAERAAEAQRVAELARAAAAARAAEALRREQEEARRRQEAQRRKAAAEEKRQRERDTLLGAAILVVLGIVLAYNLLSWIFGDRLVATVVVAVGTALLLLLWVRNAWRREQGDTPGR
ncbi:hypothetical protein ACIOJD_18985 [Streptomyces sp. NPDC088116]|uniref:hypothetical protein n=1 Tax=Streptomyces sp. NPDC088116 TaxID=3365825 RepID=UPI003824C9DC